MLSLGLSSLIEREARDPSRELVKSRKDVTPSESPLDGELGLMPEG